MPPDQPYVSQHPIFFLFDRKEESTPPSLLTHVGQGDYFGTLATVLNFLHEAISEDLSRKTNPTMSKQGALDLLDGMKNDLIHLQDNYDIVEKY